MSGLFLTAEELTELTGFRSARGQARWLAQHRWRYAVTGPGKPRVTRDYFASRVGAGAAAIGPLSASQAAEQPNFAAIGRR